MAAPQRHQDVVVAPVRSERLNASDRGGVQHLLRAATLNARLRDHMAAEQSYALAVALVSLLNRDEPGFWQVDVCELHDGRLRAYAVSRMRAMAVDAYGVHPAVMLRFSALCAPRCFADAGFPTADFELGRHVARLLATELRSELSFL